MDLLNDEYPLYEENPQHPCTEEYYNYISDQKETVQKIRDLTKRRPKKKKNLQSDEWEVYYSDDLWYLWCIMNEYITSNNLPFMERTKYSDFVNIVYRNSSKR